MRFAQSPVRADHALARAPRGKLQCCNLCWPDLVGAVKVSVPPRVDSGGQVNRNGAQAPIRRKNMLNDNHTLAEEAERGSPDRDSVTLTCVAGQLVQRVAAARDAWPILAKWPDSDIERMIRLHDDEDDRRGPPVLGATTTTTSIGGWYWA